MDNNETITGIIEDTDRSVVFYKGKDCYEFSFMMDAVLEIGNIPKPVVVPNKNGFYWGRTHLNRKIAIYAGDEDLSVIGVKSFRTSAYVVSNRNVMPKGLQSFTGIVFTGGTLNKVFGVNGIEIDQLSLKQPLKINDDSVEYDVQTADEKIHIIINSVVSVRDGVERKAVENANVSLTLLFDRELPLMEVFHHANVLRRLLSFMTYRKNVGFDTITLLAPDDDSQQPLPFAEVHIKRDVKYTEKEYFRNITVDDLQECFPKLLAMCYSPIEQNETPLLAFVPENDDDSAIMTNAKIREICSSLEHELTLIDDLQINENNLLDNLKSDVRACVKHFRKEQPGIPEGSFGLIFSSIAKWSLSLNDRLMALCEKYSDEICAMHDGLVLTDEEIKGFTKYRNETTHGTVTRMSDETALTAYTLAGVVYCCILSRIGVSKSEILELAKHKLLT